MTGRPKALEIKRRTGTAPGRDSGGRKLPDPAIVATLPMAEGIPDPPMDLGLEGRSFWQMAWGAAITWLSPDSDMKTVTELCHLADDLDTARRRFRVTKDAADGRMVVNLSKQLMSVLSALGFDPTARSRLGVAEVKRVTALDELLSRRGVD